MTESEAIKNINALNAVCMNKEFYDVDFYLALKLAVGAIEKVQIIEAIGTVEEFKALKEKQIAKKPIRNYPLKNEAWSESAMLCPTCNKYVSAYSDKYCCCCGQKLDWE